MFFNTNGVKIIERTMVMIITWYNSSGINLLEYASAKIAKENYFLLKSFGSDIKDPYEAGIADPIGQGLTIYRKAINVIEKEVVRILPRLETLIENKYETRFGSREKDLRGHFLQPSLTFSLGLNRA